jgi:hypothetical protein
MFLTLRVIFAYYLPQRLAVIHQWASGVTQGARKSEVEGSGGPDELDGFLVKIVGLAVR